MKNSRIGQMFGLTCFFSLVLFSSVNSGNVVKQVAPKDFPFELATKKVQGRIVNGIPASPNQFPYQVSVRSVSTKNNAICGGSILSSTFILTACHCTRDYNEFKVGFGSPFLRSPLFEMTSYRKIEHPDFNPTLLSNDIALIKLPKALSFNLSISPIQLPKRSQASATFVNRKVVVSGFGRVTDDSTQVSNSLNYVTMHVIGNNVCSVTYGSRVVTNNVICGEGLEKNMNACLGDSGGPMATKEDDGITIQIGIVSFVSSRGCSYGDPSGYTKVAKYLNWIAKITGIPLRP